MKKVTVKKKTPAKPKAEDARLTPGAQNEQKKFERFIEALRLTGSVNKATKAVHISKETIYKRIKTDAEFANRWTEALEEYSESLWAEVIRRGKEGIDEPVFHNGKKIADVKKYSDTLLIFAVKHHDYGKKWRQRVIQTGNIALSVIATRGPQIGLTAAQIEDIQLTMTQEFASVATN